MRKVTDTFHIAFDTEKFPGKIEAVEVTLRRHISGDRSKEYRIDLLDHPLYKALHAYCVGNPPRKT